MKLFIPELGTKLRLTKAQFFNVMFEPRNESLFQTVLPALSDKREEARKKRNEAREGCFSVITHKGTVLEVDRIYIRQGNSSCSSVTFKIRGKKVIRFWLPLEQVNRIECEVVGEPSANRHKSIPRCSVGG